MLQKITSLILSIALLLPAGSSVAVAQEPVFRTTTKLVEVSVVVTDGKGQPVQGLKKDDFTVLEDGKAMQVAYFGQPGLEAVPAPPKLPKGIFTNRPELLPHAPKTVTAIVIDYLNASWENQTAAREQVMMVLRTLGPDDVVAVYTMSQNLRVLHDYTSDRKSLEEKLMNSPGVLAKAKTEGDLLRASADRWQRAFGETRSQAEFAYQAAQTRTRMSLTMNTLSLIARHLAGLPGRRNLVWLSEGFPWTVVPINTTVPTMTSMGGGYTVNNLPGAMSASGGAEASLFLSQMNRTIQAISDAGVSVYGIDVNRLEVPTVQATDQGSTLQMLALRQMRRDDVQSVQASMVEVATRTGGAVLLNSNDLTKGFKMAIEDARNAYVLGYYPVNDKADGKFRKLEVKVKQAGVKVRHRPGYTADDPGRVQVQSKGDLEEATTSPVGQTGILLTAQALPGDKGELKMVLQIEPRQVSFRKVKDEWVAQLDLLFYQRLDNGKVSGTQSLLPVKLNEEGYKTVIAKGLLFRKAIEPEKGATSVRVVVRDNASGAIGTLDIPFQQK